MGIKQGIVGISLLSLVWSMTVSAHAPSPTAGSDELVLLSESEIAQISAMNDADDMGEWTVTEADPQDITDQNITDIEANAAEEDELGLAEIEPAYALPKRKVLQGTKTLACVGVFYTDHRYVTADKCRKLATRVANFYARNSRGKLKLIPIGRTIEVDFKANVGNIGKAERLAKQRVKADYYIVPSVFKKRGNHAGNRIAHLSQMTGWVATHEVGHLLGLGHTGRYVYSKEGKVKLEHYGDTDSVMSKTGSNFLTAPQYYHKGWLPDEEVALYDPTVRIYELKKITNFKGEGLATVVIPPAAMRESGKGRPAFVAFSAKCKKGCATLYLSSGGSSQRVMTTYDEFHDEKFTNLRIKVLDSREDKVFVSIERVE